MHRWTLEQEQFLKDNIKGTSFVDLTRLFNEYFNLDLKVMTVKSRISRLRLTNGLNGCFQKGHKPFNKDTKGLMKSNVTSFKKGNYPANAVKVGSKRVRKDGYTYIKVAGPNKWKPLHHVIYEKHNGAIPKGSICIFLDYDITNYDINNLHLVTRSELLYINQFISKLDSKITSPIKKSIAVLAKLERLRKDKANERQS